MHLHVPLHGFGMYGFCMEQDQECWTEIVSNIAVPRGFSEGTYLRIRLQLLDYIASGSCLIRNGFHRKRHQDFRLWIVQDSG